MSKLKTEKRCRTSRRNIGMCDSDVNVLFCCKFAEHVDPWFRNSTEVRRASIMLVGLRLCAAFQSQRWQVCRGYWLLLAACGIVMKLVCCV